MRIAPKTALSFITLAVVCLVIGASALSPAMAQSDPAERMFAKVTEPMSASRRVQFCAFVAQNALTQAVDAPTPQIRASRELGARRLLARLAPHLASANASLSKVDSQRIDRENNEYMGLLSNAPSQEIGNRLNDPAVVDDFLGLWLADIVNRCNALADKMGLTPAPVVDGSQPRTP